MYQLTFRAMCVFVLGVCVIATGCGPSLVRVEGVVTLDGDPVPNAAVTFTRQESGETAHGMTNQSGEFTLKTTKLGEGALAGEHAVVVSCVEYVGAGEQADGVEAGSGPIQEKWITPQRYADPKTSGLTQTVNAGMKPIEIALKSKSP